MKATVFHQALLALSLTLTSCATSLPLAMSGAEPINVSASGFHRTLHPADPDYRRLQAWVAANRSGWSHVYATNPIGGISVSLDNMSLQFVGNAVFTLTDRGMFTKDVNKADYSFLFKAAGT